MVYQEEVELNDLARPIETVGAMRRAATTTLQS